MEVDYLQGMSQAIRHLRDLGHRAIALVSGPRQQVSARAYVEAPVSAMKDLACEPCCIVEGDHHPESGASRRDCCSSTAHGLPSLFAATIVWQSALWVPLWISGSKCRVTFL